jgi:hypothetical protein
MKINAFKVSFIRYYFWRSSMKQKLSMMFFLCITSVFSQSIETKLIVVQNDNTVNGMYKIVILGKGTGLTSANTMSGATYDINYDTTVISYPNGTLVYNAGLNSSDGANSAYSKYATRNTGTAFVRVLIAGSNVNLNGDGTPPGFDFSATYDTLVTIKFKILNPAAITNLSIAVRFCKASIFRSHNNEDQSGISTYPTISAPVNLSSIVFPFEQPSLTTTEINHCQVREDNGFRIRNN